MKKQISKLSILFIAAILIPGLILTWFSIQNIASMQDVSEKRLLEEESRLADTISRRFQELINAYSVSFFQQDHSAVSKSYQRIISLDSLDYVDQSFLVNGKGDFLWPDFLDQSGSLNREPVNSEFRRLFSAAESAEFIESDLSGAADFYRNAAASSESDFQRASAVNGLARVLTKRGLIRQAYQQYRILASNYGAIIDETGIPFAHYAIHQFMRLSGDRTPEAAAGDVVNSLEEFFVGKVPLTSQTVALLGDVARWSADLDSANREKVKLNRIVEQIRESLQFVLQHRDAVKELIKKKETPASSSIGSYDTVSGADQERPYLLVLNRKAKLYIPGFAFNLEFLKTVLIQEFQDQVKSLDLEMEIKSIHSLQSSRSSYLSVIRELSPLISSWRIHLRPKNPNALNRFMILQKWIYAIAIAFLVMGMILGVVLVMRDISREKKLARLRSDFVSNVTHELKTPLTSIRMFAETMRMGRIKKKAEQQEYLSVIVNESERLTRLINTVLDFSKIEQGEKQYGMEKINLSLIVERALNAMTYWLKEHGFSIHTNIQKGISILGDGDALEQAVLNLISNSMKYSGNEKDISVQLMRAGDSVHISVTDKGLGIPESKQPYIFNQYYRAHVDHEKKKEGSGLGLTVVKHIVEAHHGHIELKSKVDQGSTFIIVLPLDYSNRGGSH